MNVIDVPFVLPWAVFAVCWAVLGFVVVGIHCAAWPMLGRIGPRQRGNLLLALALAPIACGAAVAVLGFAPAVGGYLIDAHCHANTGCRPHVPALQMDASIGLLLTAAACTSAVGAAWAVAGNIRAGSTLARALERLSRRSAARTGDDDAIAPTFALVESPDRFAYCAGLFFPRIVVSRGLVDALTPKQLGIVLAHEHAHAQRRDNLRRVLAGVGLWFMPRRLRRRLLGDLAVAAEMACDQAAAQRAGGVDLAIETLEALERLRVGERRRADPSGSSQAMRVRAAALAAPENPLPSVAVILAGAAIFVALVLYAASATHHGIETFVAWMTQLD